MFKKRSSAIPRPLLDADTSKVILHGRGGLDDPVIVCDLTTSSMFAEGL